MAIIRPFSAIRPKTSEAKNIAALPYDVVNEEEARAIVQEQPHSFLKIDRAEVQFEKGVDHYDPKIYIQARDTITQMLDEGLFIQEEAPCYYLYQLTWQGRSQIGLVSVASIDDYLEGIIKKHENTREEKEQDRIRHVDVCNAQTGPIFLAYRKNEIVKEIINKILDKNAPIYDFTSDDQIQHRVWKISEPVDIQGIEEAFRSVSQIYIADGHHRTASAVKVGLKRREENKNYQGDEAFNYFLSVLFSHDELEILPYNRVVKDLNGFTVNALLAKLDEDFQVTDKGVTPYAPHRKGAFGMYVEGKWYELILKEEKIPEGDPVKSLDVSLLQEFVLNPLLGIVDPRIDHRIDFVGGIRGLGELEKRVNTDMKVAFSMYPTSIEELFQVADANQLMPPKSTWFEPKLRSGLFIHSLSD